MPPQILYITLYSEGTNGHRRFAVTSNMAVIILGEEIVVQTRGASRDFGLHERI